MLRNQPGHGGVIGVLEEPAVGSVIEVIFEAFLHSFSGDSTPPLAFHGSPEAVTDHCAHQATFELVQGGCQVWSLTQFYSVDSSKSRIGVKKCVFKKRTIKV